MEYKNISPVGRISQKVQLTTQFHLILWFRKCWYKGSSLCMIKWDQKMQL